MRDLVWETVNGGELVCAASECWGPALPTYCSDRCRNRETRRRQRYRKLLRRQGKACLHCGAHHGEDGSVWLPSN